MGLTTGGDSLSLRIEISWLEESSLFSARNRSYTVEGKHENENVIPFLLAHQTLRGVGASDWSIRATSEAECLA